MQSLYLLVLLAVAGCEGGTQSNTGVPSDDAAVLDNLEANLAWAGWTGQKGDEVECSAFILVKNRNMLPVKDIEAEVSITYSGDPQTYIRSTKMDPLIGNGNVSQGVLMPMHSARLHKFAFKLPAGAWRRDVTYKVRLTKGSPFLDRTDLHDPMTLYAFLMEADLSAVKKTFEADRTLMHVRSKSGLGPIHFALTQMDPKIVMYLQSLGGDLKTPTKNGQCAYHFAALSSPEMVKFVRSQRVKPTLSQPSKRSPYDYAIEMGNVESLKALIEAGVPMDTQNVQGRTPMMNAVFEFKPSMAAILKGASASTKKFDAKSAGLIGTAIQVESIKVLEETLNITGSVNEIAPDGTTPMHLAVKMQRREQAEFLLKHGAKLDERDKAGKTPLDYAKALEHPGDREMWVAFLTAEGKKG